MIVNTPRCRWCAYRRDRRGGCRDRDNDPIGRRVKIEVDLWITPFRDATAIGNQRETRHEREQKITGGCACGAVL